MLIRALKAHPVGTTLKLRRLIHDSSFQRSLTKFGGVAKGQSARSEREVVMDEFCCLFWGYETRCGSCPLPKAVQDLFEDGTLRASSFRSFGKKKEWTEEQANERKQQAAMMSQESLLSCSLAVFGIEMLPKKMTDLKKLYKVKAKSLHPDAGGSVEGFREMVNAYEILVAFMQTRRGT